MCVYVYGMCVCVCVCVGTNAYEHTTHYKMESPGVIYRRGDEEL